MRRSATILLAASLLSACGALRDPKPQGRFVPSRQSTAQIERNVHHQVNAYRRSRGLPALAQNQSLTSAAREHSRRMAARRKLSHSGFDRRFQKLQPAGFNALAENVAMNLGIEDAASAAVNGWRRSTGHHKNMVTRKHRLTGIGVARARDGSIYLTQLFGSR